MTRRFRLHKRRNDRITHYSATADALLIERKFLLQWKSQSKIQYTLIFYY